MTTQELIQLVQHFHKIGATMKLRFYKNKLLEKTFEDKEYLINYYQGK